MVGQCIWISVLPVSPVLVDCVTLSVVIVIQTQPTLGKGTYNNCDSPYDQETATIFVEFWLLCFKKRENQVTVKQQRNSEDT